MFAMRCNSVQEQEWLEKQAEARKATQRAKQRDPSAIDSDPMWLCDRGKEFFKQENYQSAINAFTEAVTMDPTCASAYSNRGACHLKMGYPLGCAADCLKAISLLQPACDANAKSRLLAYGRRAAALVLPPPSPIPSPLPLPSFCSLTCSLTAPCLKYPHVALILYRYLPPIRLGEG